MTTYPLPTLAPVVTATGISAPSYQDILLSLQASYANIYGSDIVWDASTQDYQWVAIQAAAINDTNQTIIATYNSFSPATAQGAALSSVVKVNGIAREVPSNSSVDLTVVGQAGTTITNGLVGDNLNLNTQWDLPASVVIPPGGSLLVTATCSVSGSTVANTRLGNINQGWNRIQRKINNDGTIRFLKETLVALANTSAANTSSANTSANAIFGGL